MCAYAEFFLKHFSVCTPFGMSGFSDIQCRFSTIENNPINSFVRTVSNKFPIKKTHIKTCPSCKVVHVSGNRRVILSLI
jgi:hypothetical protein